MSCLIVLNKLLSMYDVGTETALSSELIHAVISQMREWRTDHDVLFLLDADIASLTAARWPVVVFNVELMTFMSEVISRSSSNLSSEEWDFVLCSLVSWFQTVEPASLSHVRSLSVVALVTATSRLLHCTAACIERVVPEQPDVNPVNLVAEWQDVFSASVFETAVALFVRLSSDVTSNSSPILVSIATLNFCLTVFHSRF